MSNSKGPVLVAFGATWQGKWWRDVRRVLDAIASTYRTVSVLVVNTDESPALAERFATDEIPVFKLFREGEEVRSYSGSHAFPDLVKVFAPLLK